MANRFVQNPILTTKDIKPSQEGFVVESVLNPGVFTFEGKIWLLLRVAERPIQKEGMVSLPILREDGSMKILEFSKNDPDINLSDARMVYYKGKTYLSTLSHLRLVCSDDGIHFNEPNHFPTKIFGEGALETFGIEDCRVSLMNGIYNLTYTQVSENGVGVGLMQTRDWQHFERIGMILSPHNKDCALFEEKINHNTTACIVHQAFNSAAILYGLPLLLTLFIGENINVSSKRAKVGGIQPELVQVLRRSKLPKVGWKFITVQMLTTAMP